MLLAFLALAALGGDAQAAGPGSCGAFNQLVDATSYWQATANGTPCVAACTTATLHW